MASASLRTAASLAARGRRSGLTRLGALAAGAWLAVCALPLRPQASPAGAFAVGVLPRAARGHMAVYAEPASGSPSPSPSVALVKVTEENKLTTASVLSGLAGLWLGGFWIGGALFAASAYLARKEDDDLSKALKGVASGSLEVLNFGAYLNEKYAVTDKLGNAISEAVDSAKSGTSSSDTSKETLEQVSTFVDQLVDAVKTADKDISFKETFGTLATSASDLASQAVAKAVELNDKYKLTDKLKEKIDEVSASSSTSSTTRSSSPQAAGPGSVPVASD